MESKKYAVAIGCFDGVHKAHKKLIEKCSFYAKENNLTSVALTFDPLPLKSLGKDISEICSLKRRCDLLKEAGADEVKILKTDDGLLKMSAEEFFREVIIKKLNAQYVTAGFNFHFGRGGFGDYKTLLELGKKYNIKVEIMDEVLNDGKCVSSTLIRKAIKENDTLLVKKLIGREII